MQETQTGQLQGLEEKVRDALGEEGVSEYHLFMGISYKEGVGNYVKAIKGHFSMIPDIDFHFKRVDDGIRSEYYAVFRMRRRE